MEELKRLRKAKGLSQAKLAALADLDPSTVSQIETGTRRANTRTLERLAEALDAGVADLFPKAQSPLPLDNPPAAGLSEESIESLYGWAGLIDKFAKDYQEDLKQVGSGQELFYLLMQATLTYMGGLKIGEDKFAAHTTDNDTLPARKAKRALRDSLKLLNETALTIASSSPSVDEFEEQQRAMITQLADYRKKSAG